MLIIILLFSFYFFIFKMIEVEKKFRLNDDDKNRLLNGAKLISEKNIDDTYYDTADYSLTTSDNWLRKRDGRFELKLSRDKEKNKFRQEFEFGNIIGDEKIKEELNFEAGKDLEIILAEKNYLPFAQIKTLRQEYQKDGFTIDVDKADFGFQIVEIELVVENEKQAEEAKEKITAFAAKNDLTLATNRGKVVEFLRRFKPDHFQALVKAGIVQE